MKKLAPKRHAARMLSLRHYRFDSRSARRIISFLLEGHCTPATYSDDYYLFDHAGEYGHIAARANSDGMLVFVLFPKPRPAPKFVGHDVARYQTKSVPGSMPSFLTAPAVWAKINDRAGKLPPEELRNWKRSLEAIVASGTLASDYSLPYLPNPDEQSRGDDLIAEYKTLQERLGKKLTKPYWRLMWQVYSFFQEKWADSVHKSGRMLPDAVQASDGYLAVQFQKSRYAIRRVIVDLEKAGLLQAYATHKSAEGRNHYSYIPGTGRPQTKTTRAQNLSERQALGRYFQFVVACTAPGYWQEWLAERTRRKLPLPRLLKVRNRP